MEITRSPIITKPFPVAQHRLFICLRQGGQIRKGLEKSKEIGNNLANGRLLQHDLADPDPVRITIVSPRQIAAVAAKPFD
jgi:hypothetical protein